MTPTQDDIDAHVLADLAQAAASARYTLATQARSKVTTARVLASARASLEARIAHLASLADPCARVEETIAREALAIFDRETTP